jgi:hypothetical protein
VCAASAAAAARARVRMCRVRDSAGTPQARS